MDNIRQALQNLGRNLSEQGQSAPIPFGQFLALLIKRPERVVRNVFQVFHDMVMSYVGNGVDEYPDDPESIHFVFYNFDRLFIEGSDHPFFADRLFANRLMNLVEAWKRGAQQNKIYIFEGPHGSGKSTFLNNLLLKFEQYANTEEGTTYETVWRLDRRTLASFPIGETNHFLEKLSHLLDEFEFDQKDLAEAKNVLQGGEDYVEVPCPSHDHPLLVIPKEHRRRFLDDLFAQAPEKRALLAEKEYEWVFGNHACTICSSLYQALLNRLKSPEKVFSMLYAQPYRYNRRLGEGISVFNPGDRPLKETALGNPILQERINSLLRDSSAVNYIFSRYARINNGIYALMDVKSHNAERLIGLHNIISEGTHKVEDIEENVTSLFLAVMNPEDRSNIQGFQSFLDRIEYIKIPYVLDLNTEVEIYRKVFGAHIADSFLPRVLHNFARVIIATRLNRQSEGLQDWIEDPEKYALYCDENLQLLKMEIYTGHIPEWLSEEDRKRLTAKRRRRIIAESEGEGGQGISGRDSIRIFNELYSTYARKDKLIDMAILRTFFTTLHKELFDLVPEGFFDSLQRNYNYTVLQEVKESLYYFNEERISRDLQNYLFAVNFEPGAVEICRYTGEKLEIDEEFFAAIERRLLGAGVDEGRRQTFRRATQKEYTARTLTQEIVSAGKPITATELFRDLHERYVHNLKEKVLDPFLENENFRRAIKDFGRDDFKTYDKRIRDDVTFLINNLCKKSRYTKKGAKEVCIYVIDNDLARQFASS